MNRSQTSSLIDVAEQRGFGLRCDLLDVREDQQSVIFGQILLVEIA